jgi:hypothetical protein
MSNVKKLLIAAILAIGLIPAAPQPVAAYCYVWGHTGQFPGTCNPADNSTCIYPCMLWCNDKCPPTGACAYNEYCESGGWTCHCECEYPCR